jgi:hypothetical protein
MFMLHFDEPDSVPRLVAQIGAVCLALTGIVNGNDSMTVKLWHSIISNACFCAYFIYLYMVNSNTMVLCIGVITLILGQLLGLAYVSIILNMQPSAIFNKDLYRAASETAPIILRQTHALLQWIMVACIAAQLYTTILTR